MIAAAGALGLVVGVMIGRRLEAEYGPALARMAVQMIAYDPGP